MSAGSSVSQPRPFQFRIRDLLYWTTLAALLLGLSRWEIGIAAPFIVLVSEFIAFVGLTTVFVDRGRGRSLAHRALRGVLAGIVLSVPCLWPIGFLFWGLGMIPELGFPAAIALGAVLGLVIGLLDGPRRWIVAILTEQSPRTIDGGQQWMNDSRYVTIAPPHKESLVRLPRAFLVRLSGWALPASHGAKRVLRFSWRDTLLRGNREVTPEHILLALATIDRGTCQSALARFGLELAMQTEEVEGLVAGLPREPRRVEPSLSVETERLLEHAMYETRSLGDRQLGAEHLLLGLLQCGDRPATVYLRRQGVTAERFRCELLKQSGERCPTALGPGGKFASG